MTQNIFITADTHFNHQMLVREEKRNFKSIEDMNSLMISNWNKKVLKDDIVYHLGDVVLNKKINFDTEILPKLNGKIIFIRGNHDSPSISITQNIILKFFGILVELVHRPYDSTKKTKIVLHGHIHKSGYRDMPFKGEYVKPHIFKDLEGRFFYNCNIEYHKYKPKTINEIIGEIRLIKNKQIKKVLKIIEKHKEIHISDLEKKLPKGIRIVELGEILGELKNTNKIKKEKNIIFYI